MRRRASISDRSATALLVVDELARRGRQLGRRALAAWWSAATTPRPDAWADDLENELEGRFGSATQLSTQLSTVRLENDLAARVSLPAGRVELWLMQTGAPRVVASLRPVDAARVARSLVAAAEELHVHSRAHLTRRERVDEMWADRFVRGSRAGELREAVELGLRGDIQQRLDELAFLERTIRAERAYLRDELRRAR